MSLATDIGDVMGAVFSATFVDATLQRATREIARGGKTTVKFLETEQVPVKAQQDVVTKRQRDVAGDKFGSRDIRILVLQTDRFGNRISAAPQSGDRIVFDDDGSVWSINDITIDAAKSHWDMRGTPYNG